VGFDIRWPIGAMFVLFGSMLAGFGLVTDPAMYARSLDININLWWGLVLLVVGLILLLLARLRKYSPSSRQND
jgi:protein-S-isoprenylcysteine O-methyltransferase Ste14